MMLAPWPLLLAALSTSEWQSAANEAALRTAGYDAIEQQARPSPLRWGLLLPNVSLSWANRDLTRVPSEESSSSAYTTRGESWQIHASWELSRWVRDDAALPYSHFQLQVSDHRRALLSDIAKAVVFACATGPEGDLSRAQLVSLTAGWSSRHPPPCPVQHVPK